MEKRLYFIVGDVFANIAVATLALAASSALIGGGLGMLPGMIVGMFIGMLVALIFSMGVLAPLLGVMEILMPCMLGGMLAGMCGGMWELSTAQIIKWGAVTGLGMLLFIYVMNALLSGPQKIDSKKADS
jgi:hypothetical protein